MLNKIKWYFIKRKYGVKEVEPLQKLTVKYPIKWIDTGDENQKRWRRQMTTAFNQKYL